jgi:formate C-acetyltransferase
VAIIGFADIVDSLAAIEQLVFKEQSLTMDALLRALEADFAGQEALVARLRNPGKTPLFGNEHPASESIALWLATLLDGVFAQKANYRGGYYRVGYWTMTNHAGFGRLAPATPNGRRKGGNFSSGITPVSGVTPALTPALHSVARLPANLLGNGVALNLKYSPAWDNQEDRLSAFAATVNGYFDSGTDGVGGMEIQFNVITRDVLTEAMNHPETHPDLLVRVSGYTAYFKDLNPQMQKEILERTEYDLRTGQAIPPPGAVA